MAHGQMSRYLENKLVRLTLRAESYTPPATLYLALYTTPITENPDGVTEAMQGAEVVGGGYARQAIAFSIPKDGVSSNVSSITFPIATGDWGGVTHWAVVDAATGGNMMYYGEFDTAREFTSGRQAVISPNRIKVELD